jgi:UDP-glucose 4-epimerase
MRCLITGASGHLGSYLTRRLVDQGAEVTALVREQSNLWRIADLLDKLEVIRADMSNICSVARKIAEAAPEVVFHLAWCGVTSDYRNDPEHIVRNVSGSLELFKVVQAAGCGGWIGVGSQAEYGPHSVILREDLPTKPVTAYGVTKLCTGLLTQKLCELSGMRFVWMRLLATYGPKDDERHLIPTVINKLLARKSPALTPGDQQWDYLYVEDAAEALCRVAVMTEARGIYNLSSGRVYTVRSIAERIRDLIDPSLHLGFGKIPYPSDQVMHLQSDISLLQSHTGWMPRIDLDEGLRRTVNWHRSAQTIEYKNTR